VPIEISPLVALEAEDVKRRVQPGMTFDAAVNWSDAASAPPERGA
jgi:hypothetical protein